MGKNIFNKKTDRLFRQPVSFEKIGDYLLSTLYRSTIGANGLNFSVRDGKRWNPGAIAT